MKMKRILAVLLTLAMLCGMVPAVSLGVTAATLADTFESSTYQASHAISKINLNRSENTLVKYEYGFDLLTTTDAWLYNHDWCKKLYDATGHNYTCTNNAGYEVAVNAYGVVTDRSAAGNMKIPDGGFVLSGHGDQATWLKNNVQIGDHIVCRDTSGDAIADAFDVFRTTADSKYTADSKACEIPKSYIKRNADNEIEYDANGKPKTVSLVTITEAGNYTGTNEWNNDVLVRATGTGQDGTANHAGYVVKFGGNNTYVPEGHFALSFAGQTISDASEPAYNGSWLFENYADLGAVVNIGTNQIFFRYDAAAAVRGANLMTGLKNETLTMPVDTVYDYSASKILSDATTNYELVDTAGMQALYNNMVEVTNILGSGGFTTQAEVEQYHVTVRRNYEALRMLEYEVRPVEMRAVWIRPLPNDRKERTVEELDKLLEDEIKLQKSLGYNQIFVEAFYNSCTVFPVPSTAGYNGLYYSQNPYLVPTTMTCGSSGQPGLNPNLSKPYDMLQRFIEICRENEVEPHIWWEVFYVGYTRTDPAVTDALFEYSVAQQIMDDPTTYANYLNTAHTGSLYYGAETDGAHQYFLNPGSTGARTFLMNTFKYILETYDAESFQLDYIRYPHTNAAKCFGYDEDTLWAFHQAYPNNTTDLYTYAGFYDAEWVQFRANYVTSFIKDLRALIAEVNPGYYLTSSPGADPDDSKKNLMQDVEYWLTNDLIDILYPMAYGQNVPGMVAPGLVANNSDHFVCIGTSAGYDDDDYEKRWLREVRDAGADGIAAFGTIDSWVKYAWTAPAITPTGNASKAASVYLQEVLLARAAKMVELGGISQTEYDTVAAAVEEAAFVIRVNGIESDEALAAINAVQAVADSVATNPKAAMTKDVNYILKIRANSHDAARQANEEAKDEHTFETIDGATYISGSDTLYVTENSTKLSGAITQKVTVLTAEAVSKLELNGVSFSAGSGIAFEVLGTSLKLELTDDNDVAADTFSTLDVTYCGTGALYSDGVLQFQMGDVSNDTLLNSTDIRDLLQANVKIVTLSAAQSAISDANGDGKINTIDTRIFLDTVMAQTL